MTEWQKGLQAFREGRVREAADRLQEAADDQEHTVSQDARFQTLAFLGAAHYALGQPSQAVEPFESALRLSPASPPPADLTFNLANSYLAAGRPRDARVLLQWMLADQPGHAEARMLLQRLEARSDEDAITGFMLGVSPDSVKKYLQTVSFSRVTDGFDPVQVRESFRHVELYVDYLSRRIQDLEEAAQRQEEMLARYRQMEDRLVQNMMQAQSAAQQASFADAGSAGEVPLSPIEALMRKQQ